MMEMGSHMHTYVDAIAFTIDELTRRHRKGICHRLAARWGFRCALSPDRSQRPYSTLLPDMAQRHSQRNVRDMA